MLTCKTQPEHKLQAPALRGFVRVFNQGESMSRNRIYQRPVKIVHTHLLLTGLLQRLREPSLPRYDTEHRVFGFFHKVVKWLRDK